MTGRNLARASVLAVLVLGALTGMAGTALGAKTLYNNIPKKSVALPALGFECCQVAQFGGAVHFVEQPRHKSKDVFTIVVALTSTTVKKEAGTPTENLNAPPLRTRRSNGPSR